MIRYLKLIADYIIDRILHPQKIASDVAWLGQQIQFVAFLAHAFTGGYIISHLFHTWKARLIAGGVLVAIGAWKEYWFDARKEVNPPQTFWDNTEDFAGWVAAAALGLW